MSGECGITLIIPTIGRSTLQRLLQQVLPQLSGRDDVMVAGDGPCPSARVMTEAIGDSRFHYHENPDGPAGDWGHTVRNMMMPKAKGTHLFFLDDDDECLPGAYEAIRAAADKSSDKILLFREYHGDTVIWRERQVTCGNVGTQIVVVPNMPERLGVWKPGAYEGDYWFILGCVDLHPLKEAGVEWREEIIARHGIGGI